MRQVERKRHIVLRLIGSISKHHTLVASTLVHRILTLHTAVDVGTLLMNGREHATRITLKHVLTLRITNLIDYLTSYELEIYVSTRFHLTGNHYLPGCH